MPSILAPGGQGRLDGRRGGLPRCTRDDSAPDVSSQGEGGEVTQGRNSPAVHGAGVAASSTFAGMLNIMKRASGEACSELLLITAAIASQVIARAAVSGRG